MITVRLAEASDSRSLFAWRNDPLTRAASASTDEIAWDDHLAWLERMVGSDDHRLYIATLSGVDEPVGQVRFDIVSDGISADVSIGLNPEFRGRGLGRDVLEAGIAAFDSALGAPIPLHAVIRPANGASIRLFESVGFTPAGGDGVLLHFRREVL